MASQLAFDMTATTREDAPMNATTPAPAISTGTRPADEPTYLGWLDDRKRQTGAGRVAAVERFQLIHGHQPAVALVHPDQPADHHEVAVRAARFVPRSTVYVGPIRDTG